MRFRNVMLRTARAPFLALVLSTGLSLVAADSNAPAAQAKPRRTREARPSLAEMFEQYDADKDGRVTAAELGNPGMMLMLDRDRDGVLTRREVAESVTDLGGNRRWARVDAPGGILPDREPIAEAFKALPPAHAGVGRQLPSLDLPDLRGRTVQLGSRPSGKGRVIAATSSSCPVTRKFAPTLARLEKEWSARGFEFVFVGSLPVDPAADLARLASDAGWKGPVVRDADGTVSARLGFQTTAEVIVADAAGTVMYRGAISDQYGVGYSRESARRTPLADALAAVERGERPALAATTAPGCVLEKPAAMPDVPAAKLTFHGRISRLMQTHCVECHHAGGVGPFPLESYEDVVGHAAMIRKQVERGQMPPWFAAPSGEGGHSKWLNDRSLPDEDRRDLLAWLGGDRAKGDPATAPLPLRFETGWAIGKPDVVFQLPKPVAIPADGVMPYQKVSVETKFTEEKWVTAMEIQPTAKAAVHHVLVFLRGPDGKRIEGDDASDEISGFFGAYVPGNAHQVFPPGFGKRIPAGAVLRFQIHYTPFGTATNDQLRMGLVLAKEKPRHRVHVIGIANPGIRIPAGAAHHEEYAALSVPRDARLLAFLPHMHVRGKAFRYELVKPGGEVSTLLDVPRYDFNWQLGYRLAEPLAVSGGSRLRVVAAFDNSTGNAANPDAGRVVKWGDQTYDEMLIGYLEYYFPEEGT